MTTPDLEPEQGDLPGGRRGGRRPDAALLWAARIMCLAGVIVTAVAANFTGAMLKHGQVAYLALLVVVFLASAVFGIHFWLRSAAPVRLKPLRWLGVVAFTLVLAAVGWLVPSGATEPSLLAMRSDARVTVIETPDQIVLAPTQTVKPLGLFFQPGARVDARAYVATLRPLAAEGFTVVIPKQPLGVAFLATGAFKAARAEHRPVDRLGGGWPFPGWHRVRHRRTAVRSVFHRSGCRPAVVRFVSSHGHEPGAGEGALAVRVQ